MRSKLYAACTLSSTRAGEVLSAAADPDLSLQAVRQALETNISLPRLLRHTNRGPGGISGNFEPNRPEAPGLEWEA